MFVFVIACNCSSINEEFVFWVQSDSAVISTIIYYFCGHFDYFCEICKDFKVLSIQLNLNWIVRLIHLSWNCIQLLKHNGVLKLQLKLSNLKFQFEIGFHLNWEFKCKFDISVETSTVCDGIVGVSVFKV